MRFHHSFVRLVAPANSTDNKSVALPDLCGCMKEYKGVIAVAMMVIIPSRRFLRTE